MTFTLVLLFVAFIVFPVAGLELSRLYATRINDKILLGIAGFFVLHNFFYILGISLIGDYIDYIIYALEYFYISFIIGMMYRKKNIFLKSIGVLGTGVMILSVIFGFLGFIFIIFIAQDYESDKIYTYESNGKRYQIRRYSSGFATLDNTKYTYDTYRKFAFVPIEYNIDATSFLYPKTQLNPNSSDFKIIITPDKIIFSSENGAKLSKKLY